MAPKKDAVDDDPVVQTYDVFITPELQKKLYLLQFPTQQREKPYNETLGTKPLQMRVKPRSGFVEVDVPIASQRHYNTAKAKAWKDALAASKSDGVRGHGIASGFAPPPPVPRNSTGVGRAQQAISQEEDEDDEGMNYQTLGGQISREESGKPVYMIGTFRQKQLHLTKLDAMVQMRPQFHYIDATTQLDRSKIRRDREATEVPKPAETRMVQQSVKSADSAAIDPNSAKELLQAAHEEHWTTLDYRDEEEEEAYELYHERLFFNPSGGDPPKLASSMDNDAYLEKMSAPRVDAKGRMRVKPLTKRAKPPVEISATEESEGERGE